MATIRQKMNWSAVHQVCDYLSPEALPSVSYNVLVSAPQGCTEAVLAPGVHLVGDAVVDTSGLTRKACGKQDESGGHLVPGEGQTWSPGRGLGGRSL